MDIFFNKVEDFNDVRKEWLNSLKVNQGYHLNGDPIFPHIMQRTEVFI